MCYCGSVKCDQFLNNTEKLAADCILFPGWLFMSTRKEFPELWMSKRENYNGKNVKIEF